MICCRCSCFFGAMMIYIYGDESGNDDIFEECETWDHMDQSDNRQYNFRYLLLWMIKIEKSYCCPLGSVYISNTQMYSSDVHELEMQFEDYFWKLKANLDFEIISNLSSNWISIIGADSFISFFVKCLRTFAGKFLVCRLI